MKRCFYRIFSCVLGIVLFYGFFGFLVLDSSVPLKAQAADAETNYVSQVQGDNIYYIKNQHSGLYLSVADNLTHAGLYIEQNNYHGGFAQQFKLSARNDEAGLYYTITPMSYEYLTTKKTLKITGNSYENNAEIHVESMAAEMQSGQKFRVQSTGNGDNSFVIRTGSSSYSKCMTVYQASKSAGTVVIQYSYYNHGNDDNDHWYFEEVPSFGGTYYIKNQKSGLNLDVFGGKSVNETKLIQYKYHGGINQQFRIETVTDTPYYTLTPVCSNVDKTNTRVEVKDGTVANEALSNLGQRLII